MFKIDWPCALGGVAIGYYAKGKVEATKQVVKRISTDAMDSLKESFADFEASKPQNKAQSTKKNG